MNAISGELEAGAQAAVLVGFSHIHLFVDAVTL